MDEHQRKETTMIRVSYYPEPPVQPDQREYRFCKLLHFEPDVDAYYRMKFRGRATIEYQEWMQHEAYARQPDGSVQIREFMLHEDDLAALYREQAKAADKSARDRKKL